MYYSCSRERPEPKPLDTASEEHSTDSTIDCKVYLDALKERDQQAWVQQSISKKGNFFEIWYAFYFLPCILG